MSTDAVTPLRHRMIEDMNARKLCAGLCHGNWCGHERGQGLIGSHAAATASDHCAAASARKIRSVDRETRWR